MDEIEDLYLSGIASAKAGNRRLAQAYFKRVIRLNTRHKGAWLWLSEVLDDPDDVAYCLQAALAIDPDDGKARLGLELLQQRGVDPQQPHRPLEWSPLAELREMDLPAILAETPPPSTPAGAVEEGLPRRGLSGARRWIGVAGLCAAVVVILVLSVLLTMLSSLPEKPPDLPDVVTEASVPTIDVSSLREQERVAVREYFYQLDAVLSPLRLAHDVYRGQINVRVSLADQVDRTGRLLVQIEAALEQLQQLDPPEVLIEAHRQFVQGLALERDALEGLLQYYATSQYGYATKSTVWLQEAGMHMERAKALWAVYREWAGVPEPTRLATPTAICTPTYGFPPTVTPTFRPYPTSTPTPFPTQRID